MSQPPIRLLHASDLHLEQPLSGVSLAPDHLRALFLDAPYRAVEQIVGLAIAENVDALLLSGDVVLLERAGPRAAVFLIQQFERLADHKIAVYWAGGDIDPPESWPPSAPLPGNVHVFPVGRVETHEHRRGGEPIARIQGVSRSQGKMLDDSGFHRDAHGMFTVGVAHGTAAAPGEEGDRVHYMALGGQHRRQTVDQSPGIAHYAGTPQGRRPAEVGAHGCTLVTVDAAGHVKTRFLPVDALRWITEVVEITASVDEAALVAMLRQRVDKLRAKHPDRDLLVTWQIRGRGELINYLRPGGLSDDLLAKLRKGYGNDSPAVWSVAIQCDEPLDVPAEWYDQETILGDLLREFRDLATDPDAPLDLESLLPEEFRETSWEQYARVGADERESLLLAAAKLGIELVSDDVSDDFDDS